MKRKLSLLFVVVFSACAPGLGTEVEVTALPAFETGKVHEILSGKQFNVRKFSDDRRERDSIEMNDRKVIIVGDLGTIVQGGLTDAIRQHGGRLCLFDCPTIEGEISQWSLRASPNFPTTKVTSKAELVLRVVSQDGKVLWRGKYSGSMNGERPFYTEQQLLDAFGQSMNEAILSAVSDLTGERWLRQN